MICAENSFDTRHHRGVIDYEADELGYRVSQGIVRGFIHNLPVLIDLESRRIADHGVDFEDWHDVLLVTLHVLLQIKQ